MEKKKAYIIAGTGGLVLLGGIAAVAGPALYSDYMESQNAALPSISMSAPSSESGASTSDRPVLAGSWQVASGSEAGYRVQEVLNGQDVTVTGRTGEVTGNFTVSDDGTTLENASFTVNLASIATDSERRDKYFRDTALDTGTYPTAELTVTEPVDLGQAPAAGETRSVSVTGQLTIKGSSQPVTFTVQVAGDGSQTQVATSIPISFADFGVEAPSLGFVTVQDQGSVEVQLTATPAS